MVSMHYVTIMCPLPLSQANNCVWTKGLARQCHDSGLMSLLVGTCQPPMRLGAMRVMMSSTSMGKLCVLEDCM